MMILMTSQAVISGAILEIFNESQRAAKTVLETRDQACEPHDDIMATHFISTQGYRDRLRSEKHKLLESIMGEEAGRLISTPSSHP